MKRIALLAGWLIAINSFAVAKDWQALYEPVDGAGIPCRVMKPANFDANQKYPVILSLHGSGGKGSDNRKQLKNWNEQLADPKRREQFPCYVVAPQTTDLWNAVDLTLSKAVIRSLPSVDMKRIYVLGHSMGGHGTYIFIQLAPDYFAAAAPSAGSGLKTTEEFIDPKKIRDIPIWAFHGDQDNVCPIEKDQNVFDAMKTINGNMKFTIWPGGKHNVSSRFIRASTKASTQFSSDRCDKEPEFMMWLFNQKRK